MRFMRLFKYILFLGILSGNQVVMAAGIGVQLGSYGSIVGKESKDSHQTWKGSMGWDLSREAYLVLTADTIVQEKDLFSLDGQDFRGYYGAGVYFASNAELAGRLPLGLSWLGKSQPIEIFLEIAPSLAIYPRTSPYVSLNLGALWYMNH